MISVLTLGYVIALALLVWFRVIRLTFWWKLSPILWMLICLAVLILPLQWGAPSGTVNVYRDVIEIIPQVGGEVVDLRVKPMIPMRKGEVLFQIDPRPYEAEVNRLEAALAAAEQMVPQLEAALGAAQASLEHAVAQRDLQKLEFERDKSLFDQDEGAISERELNFSRQSLLAAEATVRGSEAAKEQARMAFESNIDGENTKVAELKAQLEIAKLNLDWTTVRAPGDGYALKIALRPGQRVVSLRSWLAFVDETETRVAVGIDQYQLRHVKVGQLAEVVFRLHPGRTFSAKVDTIFRMNASGQMVASGVMQDPAAAVRPDEPYGVILRLDDTEFDRGLHGGASGTAAIYTNHVTMIHIIRRVELRMQTWLNYILP